MKTGLLRRDLLVLLLLLIPFFMAPMGLRPLSVPDEGRYSEVAREMLQSGDFVTPRVNGIVFLDKPVLHYWLQAVSFKLFGVNTWSVRLMPALFGIVGALLVFVTGWQLFGRRAAWWAAVVLVSNPLYFLSAQYANMDLQVAIWISAALCLFLLARPSHGRQRGMLFALAWVAVAGGILTKGLIALLLPLLVVGVWVVSAWRWREIRDWPLLSGLVIVLALCAPWYILVQQQHPQFLNYFFVHQQFERFTSNGFNNEFPFWFYLPVLLVGVLPWSLFLPTMFYRQWRDGFGPHAVAEADSRQLLWWWALLVLIFFSLPASKIIGYILPLLPPIAILAGDYISRQNYDYDQARRGVWRCCLVAGPLLGAGISLVSLLWLPHYEKQGIYPLLKPLRDHWQQGDEIIHYREYFQDLPLYVQNAVPLKVVDDWDDPAILQRDNWRREFYLGLQIQTEARQWLIDESAFAALLSENALNKTGQQVFVFCSNHDAGVLVNNYPFVVLASTAKNSLLLKKPGP